MKTKSGPHLGWPNIDANNTGPAYIGDGSLASSMGSTPTQAFAPCDPWERPDLTATSGEVSASHDLRLHCPQPLPPPDEGRNVERAAPRRPRRAGVGGLTGLCCQAMMRFSPVWEEDCPDVPSSKYRTVAKDRRILRVQGIRRHDPTKWLSEGRSGLAWEALTYQSCEALGKGEAILEHEPPATPPYEDYRA
jgi:hypothetical protein